MHEGACSFTNLCTFENGNMCGYTNDPTADFNWKLASGNSSSFDTGPIVDVSSSFKVGFRKKNIAKRIQTMILSTH